MGGTDQRVSETQRVGNRFFMYDLRALYPVRSFAILHHSNTPSLLAK
jgi:hypothetical protein